MADNSTSYIPLTEEQRHEKLWALWQAILKRLLEALEGDKPARASTLEVARKFLSDQGIDVRSRPDLRAGLKALAGLQDLPFDENGEPN